MRLTPWFPSDVKPKRRGVYKTQYFLDEPGYSYWNGAMWTGTQTNIKEAHGVRNKDFYYSEFIQEKKWRGLTKETK